MIIAAVPVKNHLEDLTLPLLDHLRRHEPSIERILVIDNGSTDGTLDWLIDQDPDLGVQFISRRGAGIYGMWNAAVEWASEHRGTHLALLNNDIVMAPRTIDALVCEMRHQPRAWAMSPEPASVPESCPAESYAVRGTYRTGGLLGWCFVLRLRDWEDKLPVFDEQFEWWGGDDDLCLRIEQLGHEVHRLAGVGIVHKSSSTAEDGTNDWTFEAKVRDRERLVRKWGANAAW